MSLVEAPVRFGPLGPTGLRPGRRTFRRSGGFAASCHIRHHFRAVAPILPDHAVAGAASRGSCNSHRLHRRLRGDGAPFERFNVKIFARIIFEGLVDDRHHVVLREGSELAGVGDRVASFVSMFSLLRLFIRSSQSLARLPRLSLDTISQIGLRFINGLQTYPRAFTSKAVSALLQSSRHPSCQNPRMSQSDRPIVDSTAWHHRDVLEQI